MARTSKKEIIKGIERVPENKLIVQKSLPLFSLWQSELTLAEFKILDVYLSRINSHFPEKRVVTFEKGELEKILGVTQIKNDDLKQRLSHLMGNVIEVKDESMKKGFKLVTLFEEAIAEQDDNGIWQVNLECTQKAMQYFFNIEDLGYLRYKLKLVTSISSRYSYILFCYLENNRFRKSWQIELNEFKQILNCTAERYNQFKYFNAEILKTCHKELNDVAGYKYTYEPIKKGRKVVAIKFTLETLSDLDEISQNKEQLQLSEEFEKYNSMNDYDQWIESLRQLCNYTFTYDEMNEFVGLTKRIPLNELYNPPSDDIWLYRMEYIDEKYRAFKVADNRDPIKNKYAYFKKMIEKDISEYE